MKDCSGNLEMLTMTDKDIISHVDHTALSPTLTWKELETELRFAADSGCAGMAISPNYVKRSREFLNEIGSSLDISSCISFPRGDTTTAVKIFEINDSIKNGATEIDAVVNLCEVKNSNWKYIETELREMKKACGEVPLKLIIETSELTKDEKIRLCELISETGVDYVKTSTGFSSGGATEKDVRLMKSLVGKGVKVKAAGGIRTLEAAEKLIEAGADRIGASRLVKLAQQRLNQTKPQDNNDNGGTK